jgi:hypothetical protein
MANLATHIRDMLWRCTPQVHMIDFDRVDPAWLDPTYTGSPGEDFRKHIGDFIHRAPYIPKDPIKFILRDSFEYRILNPVNA